MELLLLKLSYVKSIKFLTWLRMFYEFLEYVDVDVILIQIQVETNLIKFNFEVKSPRSSVF